MFGLVLFYIHIRDGKVSIFDTKILKWSVQLKVYTANTAHFEKTNHSNDASIHSFYTNV